MRRHVISAAIALALLAALVMAYWPALRGGFVWDDDAHVTRGELQSGQGLARIWAEPGATQQYYPVLHSAFWLEHRLWGDSPLGYHLVNLALHALSAGLLYLLLRRLEVPGALLGAAVFALHPVCVESVAWISEQKNTLSTALGLMAALAYLRFDRDRRPGSYALGIGLFALALLSKSVIATLPAALLVLFWWKRGRLSWRGDVLPLVPWFCMSAGISVATTLMERNFIGAKGAAFELPVVERFLVAGRAAWFYAGKVVWPAGLSFNYPRWTPDSGAAWQYAFPAAALAVLAALLALRNRSRGPLAACLLFLGTLFPALGFINVYPFVFSFVADHFQYLAAAGLIAALAAACALAVRRLPRGTQLAARAGAIGVLGLLAGLSRAQSARYADIETFYRAILDGNPASWMAHDNLGVVLVRKGRFDEAMTHYRDAIRLNPDYPEAYNNLGNALAQNSRWLEAADAYAAALRVRPSFAAAEYNWGYAMSGAGSYREAEAHFRNALRLQPSYPEAHYELANALANSGRLPEAVAEYKAVLLMRPNSAEARTNLGIALAQQGLWADALTELAGAVRLRPGNAEVHADFAYALAGAGRLEDAVAQFRESLRVGPNLPGIHEQIGLLLRKLGREKEAGAEFDDALRLKAVH